MFDLERFILITVSVAILIVVATIVIILIAIVIVYIRDRSQAKHAILHNYPVIGHFRYFFEFLGHFFRQYFFAADREELPFNRATRTWIYKASKDIDSTSPFGSTQPRDVAGSLIFINHPYPTLKRDSISSKPLVIGMHCKHPYNAPSLFNISAMSYGSLSKPAIRALSKGAKLANCWLNTGEGGVSPYHLEGGCDLVAQIGTAKYGYRDLSGNFDDKKIQEIGKLEQVKMFEIKLSQGAKPGKGGILPAEKVNKEIAEIRGIEVNKDSISPNRFPEIENEEDLLKVINKIRNLTGKPVGIKAVIGNLVWLDKLATLIKSRPIEEAPDFINVDGAEGGTGAAPMALMDYMGLSIRESLPKVVSLLEKHDLRNRIKVIAAGKLNTPSEVAWAICAGADFVVSARGFMFALGCIQAMQCNKNTCPTGITTHKKRLQEGLNPENKAVRVMHYVENVLKDVGQIAHSCGVKEPRQLNRNHCRIVQPNGKSKLLSELFPLQKKV